MQTLYAGTRNKLLYVSTKLKNLCHEFWYREETHPRFTPDVDAVELLEREIEAIEAIANRGEAHTPGEWRLIEKFTTLADEFRTVGKLSA
ncbi:MAG: hypothetical protein FWE90_08305 [Defluviitaleaceae bacterium]|nr:hypothetical protein [Defluviitaleaceae bacterium]